MKNIIVAYDKNRVIGKDGRLPWQGDLPADMKHFKQITIGHVIIMGRLTLESIGQPLPDRDNIVLSKNVQAIDGCKVAGSLEEAYGLADINRQLFIIGGESVFRETISDVNRIYATEIDAAFEGDRFFPTIDKDKWELVSQTNHRRDTQNRYDYSFLVYDALG